MERRRAVIVLIAILLVACWSHVYMVSCIAFTYLYWSNPTLQCADATTSSGVNDEFPVPKILHQTWKTKDLPDKWKQAQRSCIDLHPDYEYRFWTDDDALQLIKVIDHSSVCVYSCIYLSSIHPITHLANRVSLILYTGTFSVVFTDLPLLSLQHPKGGCCSLFHSPQIRWNLHGSRYGM